MNIRESVSIINFSNYWISAHIINYQLSEGGAYSSKHVHLTCLKFSMKEKNLPMEKLHTYIAMAKLLIHIKCSVKVMDFKVTCFVGLFHPPKDFTVE